MPSVDVPGGEVFVRDLNPAGGDPIVMIHGLLTNHTVFLKNGPAQMAKHRRVTLYDLRGHGLTELAPTDFRLTTIAQDLFALMDALGIDHADIVGYSFGAAVAIQACLTDPERVGRLALIEPFGLTHDLPSHETTVDEGLESYSHSTFVRVSGRRSDQLRSQLAQLFDDHGLVESLAADEGFFDRAPLDHLTQPVLVLAGKSSPYRGDAETAARRLPNSTLVMTRGDHNLPVTRAGWVRHRLIRWGKEMADGYQRT